MLLIERDDGLDEARPVQVRRHGVNPANCRASLPMQSKEPRPCRAEATPVDLSHGRTSSFERLASSELPRSCIPPWAGGSLRPAQVHPDTVVNVELLLWLRDSTLLDNRPLNLARAQGTARHRSAGVVSLAAQYCLRQCGRLKLRQARKP